MFKINKVSPQLLVNDIERAIAFYTKELGFAVDFLYEDFYAGITKDGYSIHLKAGKPSPEERKSRRSHEDIDILFSLDGIEEVYEVMLKKSVEIIQPLRNMPYGKEFYVTDPDGYVIAFLGKV